MATDLIPYSDMERMAAVVAQSGLFGIKTPTQALALIKRLYERVKIVNGCWVFTGSTGNSGYGKLRVGRHQDYSVHRMSFTLLNGSIPIGKCVLHTCDVRRCINPDHLFIGTKRDNTLDMIAKGRHVSGPSLRTCCPKGHEYSGINSKGRRICRICQSAASLRHYHRTVNGRM